MRYSGLQCQQILYPFDQGHERHHPPEPLDRRVVVHAVHAAVRVTEDEAQVAEGELTFVCAQHSRLQPGVGRMPKVVRADVPADPGPSDRTLDGLAPVVHAEQVPLGIERTVVQPGHEGEGARGERHSPLLANLRGPDNSAVGITVNADTQCLLLEVDIHRPEMVGFAAPKPMPVFLKIPLEAMKVPQRLPNRRTGGL